MPLNEETVARAMAGGDVQVTYAGEWLNGQRGIAPPDRGTSLTSEAGMDIGAILGAAGIAVMLVKRM